MATEALEPLVLVPGLMCDGAAWQPVLERLGRPATIVDHGDADSLVEMAVRLLAEAPPRFALAGHSMGGRVALEVVRIAPDRVSRLALLDTGYRARAAGAAGAAEEQGRYELLQIAREQGVRAMAAAWVQGMVHAPRLADAALVEAIVAMFERKSADLFERQIRALLGRPDATELLGRVRVPTLVLCGRHDGWAPLAQHQQIADRVANARLEVIDDAGHMSTMEQPAAVAAALARWLAGDASPLERLQAEAACRELVIAAAEAADSGDWQRLADCYTPDATLVRPGGVELHGRDAIHASYAAKDPDRLTQHLVCNLSATLRPDGSVDCRSKVLLWSGKRSDALTPRGRPADAQQQVGQFVDRLVRTGEGWRIERRDASFLLFR